MVRADTAEKPPKTEKRYGGAREREESGCELPEDLPPFNGPVLPGTLMRGWVAANMRRAPNCYARILDVLELGNTVTVLEYDNGWYRVTGQEWSSVWIGAKLLTPAQLVPTPLAPAPLVPGQSVPAQQTPEK